MDGCLNGWMDGWMDGWVNGWVNGWVKDMLLFHPQRESIDSSMPTHTTDTHIHIHTHTHMHTYTHTPMYPYTHTPIRTDTYIHASVNLSHNTPAHRILDSGPN